MIYNFEPKENDAYINCLAVAGRFPMKQRRTLIFNKTSVLSERQDTVDEISRRVLADPKHMKWGLLGDMTNGSLYMNRRRLHSCAWI